MEKLEHLIHILKLTKKEFAKEIGTSSGHLIKVIHGDGRLTFEHFQKISEKYNVNLNWLIADKGSIFNNSLDNQINSVNESIIKYGVNDTSDRTSIIEQIKEKDKNIIIDGVNYIGLQVILKLLLSIEKRIFEEKLKYVEEFYKKMQEQK